MLWQRQLQAISGGAKRSPVMRDQLPISDCRSRASLYPTSRFWHARRLSKLAILEHWRHATTTRYRTASE